MFLEIFRHPPAAFGTDEKLAAAEIYALLIGARH
jgi:hypothetical protein